MTGALHLFGIRHHGPGSAHSLRRALDRLDPVAVMIEGPPEADGVMHFAGSAAMVPPVALLVHARDEPQRASFFPMAEYSPEWVAMRWASAHGRPMRFIDLPSGADLSTAEPAPERDALVADPLSYFAGLAGCDDGESWWNNLVEQGSHADGLFAAIEAAMTALRDDAPDPTEREALREAHMRLALRDALAAHDGPVAAVVGAWHVPALRRPVPARADRALLQGLPRTQVVATWVPWTDTRLAAASGYRAGVVSPGWYRHLWQNLVDRDALDVRAMGVAWAARVAALLRAEGLPASTASVIDAVQLAEGLAALRGLTMPGLAEQRAASLATLCGGEDAPLRLIEARLVVGTSVGAVDPDVPSMPLLADLARQQKRLRLVPEALASEASLDLRTDAGLAKSTLLHRLLLIGVAWGRTTDAGASRGSFRERWTLQWQPELAVALVEALRWGTTIADAADGAVAERAAASTDAAALAGLVRATLLADLPAAAERCIDRLQAAAAQSGDVGPLMAAVPQLVDVLRYGTARPIPEQPLRRLVTQLVAEVCAGLTQAARQVDADTARALVGQAAALDRSLPLIDDLALMTGWHAALTGVAVDAGASPLLRGFAQRKLYDAGLDGAATGAALSRALSPAVAPADGAFWLDGFLDDAGRLLLHDAALRALLDGWLQSLPDDALDALLPQLRRAFAGLDASERRRLLATTQDSPGVVPVSADVEPDPVFAPALPLLHLILGLPA